MTTTPHQHVTSAANEQAAAEQAAFLPEAAKLPRAKSRHRAAVQELKLDFSSSLLF